VNAAGLDDAVLAAEDVARTIETLAAAVERWRIELVDHLGSERARTAAAVDPLVEAFAVPAVTEGSLVTGSGFVAAPGLLSDAAWHLAWWLGSAGAQVQRLATVDDEAADGFRDYTALEWWRVPFSTGDPHLTGPYVDYLCTQDYAVTLTVPVVVGGEFLGVVGCDALVSRLEDQLLPILRRLEGSAAVVNSSGRVVTSTDARHEPGDILRVEGLGDALAPLREARPSAVDGVLPGGARVLSCGTSSLALVVG
jgi:hypothetical protein